MLAAVVEWGRLPHELHPVKLGLDSCTDVGGVDEALRVEACVNEVMAEVEAVEFGLEIGEAGGGGLEIREAEEAGVLEVLSEGYAVEARKRLAAASCRRRRRRRVVEV